MRVPSTIWWGSCSMRRWSLKVAGSLSSPLTTRYTGWAGPQPDRAPHPAEGPVGGHLGRQLTGAQAGDEAVEGSGGDFAEEAPVDGQAGGPAAVGDALHLLEGEHPVPRGHSRLGSQG